jgi:hypothetical protein
MSPCSAARKAIKLLGDIPEDHSLLLADVLSPIGFPVDTFWKFWNFCRGCNHIVAVSTMSDHVCDLTNEE